MNDKKNAFDLLRLLLAACVMITHGILIGGYALQDPLMYFSKGQTDLAEFGVMGFFALSGFLIAASFERAGNIFVYLSHRALRILPGFWLCLVITAFVFAPAIFCLTGRALHDFKFTGQDSSLDFLINNWLLKIRQWNIKDVLSHSPYEQSLNGSLWSLYPELLCYGFTMLAGISGLFSKNKSLYLIIAVLFFSFFAINFSFSPGFGPTIFTLSPALKLYAAYVAGTLVYVFRDHLVLDKRGTLFLAAFTLLLLRFGGFKLASPLLIAMNLINIFQLFEFKVKYDVSYGLYIYGFIIQQFLYTLIGNRLPPLLFITITLFASALAGTLSFLLVERPFMNLRKKADNILRSIHLFRFVP
jgi:peptidoglycan/LPS O-acetylase OafA/YrhL